MLELDYIRKNAELVKKAIRDKGESADVDELLRFDRERRGLLSKVEALKHERNLVNKEIGKLRKEGKQAEDKVGHMRTISQKIKEMDAKVGELDKKIAQILIKIPNIPDSSVPVGPDESANQIVREWGEEPQFDFKPLNHIELGEDLNIIDFPTAAKIAGSGFAFFKGEGALLERALINLMLDLHTKKHGYTEVWPPALANRRSMTATGQLPKLEEEMYHLEDDDYFLVPTAEVPLTNIHQDDILEEEDLPLYYTAYTPCFRREAGSYGKGTKGLVRVHQFDKIELVKFARPEDSYSELESLLADAEEVLQLLGLPYRVSLLSTGELSFAGTKCYDIEAWAHGTGQWLEVSSCSNFADFQARRANIRYRLKKTGKTAYLHTLNGSGVALARTVVSLLEDYQTRDGSVTIPEALWPYMAGRKVIGK